MKRKSRLLLLLLLLALSACPGNQDGYIEATIDGKHLRYEVLAWADAAGDGRKLETISLLAQRDKDSLFHRIGINLQMYGADIKPGRYSHRATRTEHPRPGQGQTDSLSAWYSNGNPLHYVSSYPVESPGNDFKLHITQVDKTSIKGTFSGVLVEGDDDSTITVADGAFSLPVRYIVKAPGS